MRSYVCAVLVTDAKPSRPAVLAGRSTAWLCVVIGLVACRAAPPAYPPARTDALVEPVAYELDLTVVPAAEEFTGTMTVHVRVAAPQTTLALDAEDLTVTAATLAVGDEAAPTRAIGIHHDKGRLSLDFGRPIPHGVATVRIEYKGRVRESDLKADPVQTGLLRGTAYGDTFVHTMLEPLGARRVFPCFDEPRFKTSWQLTVRVPDREQVYANAPLVSARVETPGTRTFRFEKTAPIASYLVAFAVGRFAIVDLGVAGRSRAGIRVIVPEGGRAFVRRSLLVQIPQLFADAETFLGTPYPFGKLDFVGVPGWRGAMENPGLITCGLRVLLELPDSSSGYGVSHFLSGEDLRKLENDRAKVTVAHEIAHQWFGNLVTPASWNDLWLSESFAVWFSHKLKNDWEEYIPSWRDDSLPPGAPDEIRKNLQSDADAISSGVFVGYYKGGALLYALEAYLHAARFQELIRDYVKTHAYQSVSSGDFLFALERAAGPEGALLAQATSEFLDRQGTPALRVAASCEPTPHISIAQVPDNENDKLWIVPVCVEFRRGPERYCIILQEKEKWLPIAAPDCDRPVRVDPNMSGFYRRPPRPKPPEEITSPPP